MNERLAQPLDRARVKTRTDGRGGSLAYLETHDVIRTANDIFGFGKWGHEVVELRHVGQVVVHNKDKKAGTSVGYVCVVRLTVEGCVPVSGVGFGDATEYRESGPVTAHELAAKEAESDALKRALKNFGDQFGLALYDKDAARGPHVTSASRAPRSGASQDPPSNGVSTDGVGDRRPGAAASSGSTGAPTPESVPAGGGSDDPVTAALVGELLRLSKEYGANVVAVQKSINANREATAGYLSKHHKWLERQVATVKANIANKAAVAEAEKRFPIPDGAKAA